jgi:uncharacterized protein
MDTPDPDRFFTGPQLDLARAIEAGNATSVRALAPKTDLKTPGKDDMTLLMFAMMRASDQDPERLRIVSDLVRAGADVHQVVPELGTALDMALVAKKPGFLGALLDAGMPPDAKAGAGHTPALHRAATEDTVDHMRLLLDRGADVNARDTLGTPAITYALRGMQLDQVEELLDRGADPRAVNQLGQSFPNVLEQLMARQLPGSPALQKMTEIRDRITKKGVTWPPASSEAERERMRERGEEPIVPVGHAR